MGRIFLLCVLLFNLSCSKYSISPSNTSIAAYSENESKPILFYTNIKKSVSQIRANSKLKKRIDHWMNIFTGDFKETFEKYLSNGEVYRDLVTGILQEHGLPEELYYLAVIESGYQIHARSRASAVGAWQFIASTGKQYGLEVNRYIDERRDIVKSTQAAASHLRDLYNIFGSWELALAAYNAGTSRIMGTIIKGSNRDFWKLSEQNVLPSETMDYIPKFLAAITIGSDPSAYGLKVSKKERSYISSKKIIKIPPGISLRKIAKVTNISFKTLKELNPELIKNYIPNWGHEYELNVPAEFSTELTSHQMAALKTTKGRNVGSLSSGNHIYYKVRKGENLKVISRKFGVPIREIAQVNGLYNPSLIRVGQKLKIVRDFSGIYTVKSGDNLSLISSLFNTTPAMIMRLNGLKTGRIYPGQRLRVAPQASNYYVVKNGDTLWEIARENNLSIKKLLSINSLSSSRIFAGQKLFIER